MLAPDQFASPMKSIVANFIVKDLLMNDRVRAGLTAQTVDVRSFKVKTFLIFVFLQSAGDKNGKLWTTDEEVSPEVLAKVRGKRHSGVYHDPALSCVASVCYSQQYLFVYGIGAECVTIETLILYPVCAHRCRPSSYWYAGY